MRQLFQPLRQLPHGATYGTTKAEDSTGEQRLAWGNWWRNGGWGGGYWGRPWGNFVVPYVAPWGNWRNGWNNWRNGWLNW